MDSPAPTLPTKRREPSGLKVTQAGWLLSSSACRHVPDFRSQSRTVRSVKPAEAINEPSGETATESTTSPWPSRVPTQVRACKFQILIVLSSEPETAKQPSAVS